jgi:hypothetical protein
VNATPLKDRWKTCVLARPFGHAPAFRAAELEARAIRDREQLVTPRWSFRTFPQRGGRTAAYDTGDTTIFVPLFAGVDDGVTELVAAVCTIGDAMEQRIASLFETHEPTLALALDRLGTEELYRLSGRVLRMIHDTAHDRGLRAGPQVNPGDGTLSLERQDTVVALAGGARCGVSITSSGMLRPEKSLSFLVPLGPELEEDQVFGRCQYCPAREQCPVR